MAVPPWPSVIVQVKVYEPALLKVTLLFFEVFVPLAAKSGLLPAGCVVEAQVYVRFGSPPSSAPSTLSAVVVPFTVEGDADAATATVGAALVIVTFAEPETAPLVAVIVA